MKDYIVPVFIVFILTALVLGLVYGMQEARKKAVSQQVEQIRRINALYDQRDRDRLQREERKSVKPDSTRPSDSSSKPPPVKPPDMKPQWIREGETKKKKS